MEADKVDNITMIKDMNILILIMEQEYNSLQQLQILIIEI